jgi:transcriptional regulator with XRE-family HTH domain
LEYIKKLLSDNLHALRKDKSFSQVEIARAIGVSQASYARWESGEWISPESLEKLAQFYGVRSSRFFYDPEMEKPAELAPKKLSNKEIKAKLVELIEQIQ